MNKKSYTIDINGNVWVKSIRTEIKKNFIYTVIPFFIGLIFLFISLELALPLLVVSVFPFYVVVSLNKFLHNTVQSITFKDDNKLKIKTFCYASEKSKIYIVPLSEIEFERYKDWRYEKGKIDAIKIKNVTRKPLCLPIEYFDEDKDAILEQIKYITPLVEEEDDISSFTTNQYWKTSKSGIESMQKTKLFIALGTFFICFLPIIFIFKSNVLFLIFPFLTIIILGISCGVLIPYFRIKKILKFMIKRININKDDVYIVYGDNKVTNMNISNIQCKKKSKKWELGKSIDVLEIKNQDNRALYLPFRFYDYKDKLFEELKVDKWE